MRFSLLFFFLLFSLERIPLVLGDFRISALPDSSFWQVNVSTIFKSEKKQKT
jgi:hypothetical protein